MGLGTSGSQSSMKESETREAAVDWRRVALGIFGATFIGLGVGGILYQLNIVGSAEIMLYTGITGYGVGMFIEYIRPSRAPLTSLTSDEDQRDFVRSSEQEAEGGR